MTSCSVIIPIGPGHMGIASEAVASVMAAAEDTTKFPGHPWTDFFIVMGNDTAGEGRSKMRNQLVYGPFDHTRMSVTSAGEADPEQAFESDWLFFLDSDDLMCATQIWGNSAFLTAAPYLAEWDAIWGSIYELGDDDSGQSTRVSRRKQVERFSGYETFIKHHPFQTVQMGHFVRRDAFLGFDQNLDVCEDVDYYIRMWKQKRCIKQEKPLFLNRRGRHSWVHTGKGTGREWSIKASQMMREARDEI